jgi:CybS, succinate dehydrogenase cytochrome B small subunit
VNDHTTLPPFKKVHGSYHWTFEHLLSACLISLAAVAFVASGSPTLLLDCLIGISVIAHSHVGLRLLTIPLFGFIFSVYTVSRRQSHNCVHRLRSPFHYLLLHMPYTPLRVLSVLGPLEE